MKKEKPNTQLSKFLTLNKANLQYFNLFIFGIPLYLLSPFILDMISIQFVAIGLVLLFTFNIFLKSRTLSRDDYQKEKLDYIESLLKSNLILSIILISIFALILAKIGTLKLWQILIFEPFSFHTILYHFSRIYVYFLDDCINTSGFPPIFIGIIIFYGLYYHVKGYRGLCRLYLGFTTNDKDRTLLLNLFKKLKLYLGLTFTALIIMLMREYFKPDMFTLNYYLYSDFCGVLVFLFLFFWQLRQISIKINTIRLRPVYKPIINQKMFKFETDITVSEKALVFEPCFMGGYVKESKGISPIIGVCVLFPLIYLAIGFISWLFSVDLDSYFEDCYLFFGFILFITVVILCELFFLALIVYSLKYFKIERTPSEIIFQKGIKQDRIPLDQINKVVLDYTVIKSKVRILIVLFIPNHTIGIVKTIKMISMIPNQSFLESQLVKVLIKTLFLLGYAPNQ